MHKALTRFAALLALLVLLAGSLAGLAAADDTGPGQGTGTVKNGDGSLKFGIGPAKHVPPKQVVDGRAYLVYFANPGATLFDRVALFNYGAKPLRVQVYATDAEPSEDGAFGLKPGGEAATDAGKWIKLQVPKSGYVTIPARTGSHPFGVLRIPFTVSIPLKASPGDHAGGVIVSVKSTSKNKKGAKITLDQRVGLRTYFTLTGKLKPGVAIEDLKASYKNQWDPLGRGLYTVSYTLHNTGNLRVKVRQDVTVKRCILPLICPSSSLVAHPATQPDLLPGTRVKITETFKNRFGLGRPSAKVTLHVTAVDPSYTKKIPDVTASTGFWALPWLLILIIVAVLLVVGLGTWRYLRHRRLVARERAIAKSAPPPRHAGPSNN
ncbi:hypothetical protein [Nocardioides marmorisolisilvae]|uniref:DUF916 domain-containing protein n=1 Tax=Nocardioides marmorisolisilvae TaxID=1542737 RepID=A0A3N0DWW3_9ACTN|nr:hypothetical protein [Nocardioides marmorisolisilvae]RNL79986.1 hypothetical protein EFL95_13780 [Nocardioides marmorisolisilvae]